MAILGYEYRVDGGAAVDVGLVYSILVTGLTSGTTYGFQIRSYNDEGEFTDWSATVYESTFGESLVLDSEGRAILDSDGNAITAII